MIFKRSTYSLRKSKNIFRSARKAFKRKKRKLSEEGKEEAAKKIEMLREWILKKNRSEASHLAKEVEVLLKTSLKKTSLDKILDFFGAIIFALFVAILIRQTWFEFYEIPTGSMRPTLEEKDRLVVSKTSFGINRPLSVSHFYFDPSLVKRNGTLIFSGENMDISDVDTLYFYIFPGKKQYVKRLIGKPGDILYFYGGLIYGVDKDDHDLSPELQLKELSYIDHVPYIHIDGKIITPQKPEKGIYTPAILYQMNLPVAKMSVSSWGRITSEVLYPTTSSSEKYFNLWGIKNFAMARLVKDEDMNKSLNLPKASVYLELTHHPDISKAFLERDFFGRLRPTAQVSRSWIPLNEDHLKKLYQFLYTARFIVKNGHAYRYGMHQKRTIPYSVPFPGVSDGTYEFYYGMAYKILWQGIMKKLPPSDPIYTFDLNRLLTLFNVGMEWDSRFLQLSTHSILSPSRYAYFKNGAFYVLGFPLFEKNDEVLIEFLQNEQKRKEISPGFYPFEDAGPPLNEDGTLNKEFIKKYGIKVPEKHYLVLGDNYAMSADSRDFGFVPEGNIRGAPEFIFWPPGPRFGHLNQPSYPWITFPRAVIWGIAIILCIFWWLYQRRIYKIPIKSS